MVVVVASLKGGVGKSTLAAILSLVSNIPAVDYDPSASLTDILVPRCTPEPRRMFELEFCETDAGVRLVPATPEAYDAEPALDTVRTATLLREAGDVIVDTGPAWNRFTIAAVRSADVMLVPVANTYLAERGAVAIVKRVLRLTRARIVLVPTLYDARSYEQTVARIRRLAELLGVEYSEYGLRRTWVVRDARGSELRRVLTRRSFNVPELVEHVRRLVEVIAG